MNEQRAEINMWDRFDNIGNLRIYLVHVNDVQIKKQVCEGIIIDENLFHDEIEIKYIMLTQ